MNVVHVRLLGVEQIGYRLVVRAGNQSADEGHAVGDFLLAVQQGLAIMPIV